MTSPLRESVQTKVNALAEGFGFRAFNFQDTKRETALRALSRFIKSMHQRIERKEVPGELTYQHVSLDLCASLIRGVICSENDDHLEKIDKRLVAKPQEQVAIHAKNFVNFMRTRYAKQAFAGMKDLVDGAKAAVVEAERAQVDQEELDKAKEHLENVQKTQEGLRAAIEALNLHEERNADITYAAELVEKKADIMRQYPWPFNPKATATARKQAEKVFKTNKSKKPSKAGTKKSVKGPKPPRTPAAANTQMADLLKSKGLA